MINMSQPFLYKVAVVLFASVLINVLYMYDFLEIDDAAGETAYIL